MQRVRRIMPVKAEERRMFGSLAFMVSARFTGSVAGAGLLVGVGRGDSRELAALPRVRPVVMGREVMKGYLSVDPPGIENDAARRGQPLRGRPSPRVCYSQGKSTFRR